MPRKNNPIEAMGLNFSAPRFPDFLAPNGFLQDDPACHALWYYCVLIRKQIAESNETIRYEDEGPVVPQINASNIFKTIAFIYGVTPERMLQFWKNVDLQMAVVFKTECMPSWARFDKVPEIKTQ